jgi:coenzyme F420-reducing hydrogenase beta subunit
MEEIINKNKCCGCHACFNICPKKAISMVEDEKGFKQPVIDKDKCINCGLCQKVCPIINSEEDKKKIYSYAAFNKNEDERLNSSSGGIFILLAKEILKRKGVVFGAAFDKDFNVKHTYVDNEKDIKELMGSKYVQSTIGDVYKKVKELLEKDTYVLFSGTPCQIEGLRSFLKQDYDKLYTQDIICHGVPSPKVWNKYLEYQKEISNENIKKVSFRNKDRGWSQFQMKISFDKQTYSKIHPQDIFMQSFLKNTCLRNSCYNCSFKKKYRISDVTLGDYWGIKKVHPEFDDDNGVSILIINSSKGKELFNLVKKDLVYKETDLDKIIEFNPSMIKSVTKDYNREQFFDNLDKMDFDKLVKKYTYKTPMYKRAITKFKNIIKKIIKYNK